MNLKSCLGCVLPFLVAVSSSAQSFFIDWSTIDGGGGASTGGGFTLAGTIGQPDAGATTGSGFALASGFWSVFAVQTPGGPRLSVARQGADVRVFWPLPATGYLLDQSLTVTGTWSQVAFPYTTNATEISITVSEPATNRFYRLRKP